MKKITEKLQKFMYGRNGNDFFNRFLFFIYLVVFIIYLFVRHFSLLIVEAIILSLIMFRFFSKNLYKRQKENDVLVHLFSSIKRPFIRQINKIRDRKTHIYIKCPQCKKILRLKQIKGTHTVKCPICNNHFNVKI